MPSIGEHDGDLVARDLLHRCGIAVSICPRHEHGGPRSKRRPVRRHWLGVALGLGLLRLRRRGRLGDAGRGDGPGRCDGGCRCDGGWTGDQVRDRRHDFGPFGGDFPHRRQRGGGGRFRGRFDRRRFRCNGRGQKRIDRRGRRRRRHLDRRATNRAKLTSTDDRCVACRARSHGRMVARRAPLRQRGVWPRSPDTMIS